MVYDDPLATTRSSSTHNMNSCNNSTNNPEKISLKLTTTEDHNSTTNTTPVMKDSVSSTTMLPRDSSQFSIQNNNGR